MMVVETKKDETYNGWKNRATWNVSLWIGNDEPLYRAAVAFMRSYSGRRPYAEFIRNMGMQDARTPDNFKYLSNNLDYADLNDMMRELVA